jgi:tetratricopeptide (TPR) repeat protein
MRLHPIASRTLALTIASLALSGCSGHGKYTAEHMSKAKEKMEVMKSATEWEMARQAFLSGDLDKALKTVDRSIALNSKVCKSYVLRGRILMEMQRLDEALGAFEEAAKLDPKQSDPPYYTALAYERISRPDLAIEHYRKATELDPENPQYAIATAEVMIDLNQITEARAFLESRFATFKHNAGVRQSLGHIALLQKNPKEAVDQFNQARLLAPDDMSILEDLIRAQVETGEFAQAESSLSKILEGPSGKDRRDLQHLHARCLLAVERPMDARAAYLKLIDGAEGQADIEAWIGLGVVSYRINDDAKLRLSAARLVAIAPTRAEGFLLRALYLNRTGDRAAAQRAMTKASTLTSESGDATALVTAVRAEMDHPTTQADQARTTITAVPSDTN